MPQIDVLVVGAGPTGLVLALWLKRGGVRVRIIDKTAEPRTTSRALVVHARTLERYRQLGLADETTHRGLKFVAINLGDGYVALADPQARADEVLRYLDRHGLRQRSSGR